MSWRATELRRRRGTGVAAAEGLFAEEKPSVWSRKGPSFVLSSGGPRACVLPASDRAVGLLSSGGTSSSHAGPTSAGGAWCGAGARGGAQLRVTSRLAAGPCAGSGGCSLPPRDSFFGGRQTGVAYGVTYASFKEMVVKRAEVMIPS